jgi:hypothetical protein
MNTENTNLLEVMSKIQKTNLTVTFDVVEKIVNSCSCSEGCCNVDVQFVEPCETAHPYYLLVEVRIEGNLLRRFPLPFFLKGKVRQVTYVNYYENNIYSENTLSVLSDRIHESVHDLLETYVVA